MYRVQNTESDFNAADLLSNEWCDMCNQIPECSISEISALGFEKQNNSNIKLILTFGMYPYTLIEECCGRRDSNGSPHFY